MKNLLRTHSIAWAHGIKIALDAEGIPVVLLDEFDRGGLRGLGAAGMVRLAVLNDEDLVKAQAIVARLTPPPTGPPPSWRWQKPGCILLVFDVVLFSVWGALLDEFGLGTLTYAVGALAVLVFVGGSLLIMLGPRADKGTS